MSISASLVKDLRERSGAGMMDCKKALTESNGDIEAAADWLRKKGLAAAAKKSGRVAAEGLVSATTSGTTGAVCEVNSETDFVARNDAFKAFAQEAAKIALENGQDAESLKAAEFPGKGHSVQDELTDIIATLGENMNLRRSAVLSVDSGVVTPYIHNAEGEGIGRIGVLVALESGASTDALAGLAKQIAMHVAATSPQASTVGDLDPAVVEKEKKVLVEQAQASGKPDNVIEKMVEGRLNKFYKEVVLLEQPFVMDQDRSVSQIIEDSAKEFGSPIEFKGFVRFALGEGVEKKEEDFAAEVAAQLS